jgi:hypothetical protein
MESPCIFDCLLIGEESTSASDESGSDSEEAFVLDEDSVLPSEPLFINGQHAQVIGGERAGALLYNMLQVKDGDETTTYRLYDDCLIRADSSDSSNPPYLAKIVAIGSGGEKKQVFLFAHPTQNL